MKINKLWQWITIVATVLGLITGSIALYDYATKEEFTIEQSVAPETMKRLRELKPGESIDIRKGRPADEPE
jgi:hypothetical protein